MTQPLGDHMQKLLSDRPSLDSTYVPSKEVTKARLHPYQWIVYTIVMITCIAVLYSLIEGWIFLGHLQDAIQNFRSGLDGLGIGD